MDPMHPKLTDQAVDRLPLHLGRAELLEEIMTTPAVDDSPVRRNAPRRPSRYLVPLAAAAVVAAVATAPLWRGGDADPRIQDSSGFAATPTPTPTPTPDATPDAPKDPAQAYRFVLDAPGWRVDHTDESEYGGMVSYSKAGADLEISWYPAASYDDYVEDRSHIVEPPAPGEPVEVVGVPGQLWAYSPDDHTVIREVERGHWTELRGGGLSKRDFLDLLTQVRQVDRDGFEASLPAEFVTTADRAAVIDEMTDGIAGALAPQHRLTPMGVPGPRFESAQTDRYQLGAHVAGAVACAWLDAYTAARQDDDEAAAADAADALATSREWPILVEMAAEGDYPEVLWQYADDAAAGRPVEGYAGGLGCG